MSTATHAQYTEQRDRILAEFGRVLASCGMTYAQPERIISNTRLRNEFIRQEYSEQLKRGTKSAAVIYDLAQDFYLSYESVAAIVYGKNTP